MIENPSVSTPSAAAAGTAAGTPVTLASWYVNVAAEIAGSLYSVEAPLRVAAAAALHEAGCATHVDIIIDVQGHHIGVEPSELWALLAQESTPLPSRAYIDVHIIFAPGEDDDVSPSNPAFCSAAAQSEAESVLAALVGAAISHVTVARSLFTLCPDLLGHLRSSGISTWVELPPEELGHELPATADGVLLMLIPSGTHGEANPACLEKIPALTRRHKVGVDGGITAPLARAAVAAGAFYIVSGRALLRPHPDLHETLRLVKS
jgi:hypothetical protein